MTRAELLEVMQLVRAVARAEIMPRFRRLGAGDVAEKTGPLDLVTVADAAAEAALGRALSARFPGCVLVGEEAASDDPALLERIATAELCFIVDPIDGTANFCAGLPLFGVMVAVTRFGETVAGLIHDPVGDDTALALRGGGAWTEAADGRQVPMRVAAAVDVGAMTGSVSWRFMPPARRALVCGRLPLLGASWDYRCSAHSYRMLAAGHCHYLVFNRLLPWDHAAGVLLHAEAGGYAARLDGSAYSAASSEGGLICAPDAASWSALRDALLGD